MSWLLYLLTPVFALVSACGSDDEPASVEADTDQQSPETSAAQQSVNPEERLSAIDASDPNGMLQQCFEDYGVPYDSGGEVDGEPAMVFPDLTPNQQREADLCSEAVAAVMYEASGGDTTTTTTPPGN